MHIGQSKIAAGVAVGQTLVIEAKQSQHRRVQVVNRDWLLDGLEAELVGGSVNLSATHSAAGQPAGETVMVVIAAVERRQLGDGCAAELATPIGSAFHRTSRAA